MRRPRVVSGKKLLVASLGIAAASYVGCSSQTSGNLIACTDCGTGGSGGSTTSNSTTGTTSSTSSTSSTNEGGSGGTGPGDAGTGDGG